MNRTYNTLFMLMSIDGKISTGASDRDMDSDSRYIKSLNTGRYQYDELEQQTDLVSFNTGKVMAKVGWNDKKDNIEHIPVEFIIVDSKPHLTEIGVRNLIARTEKLYIVTTDRDHPAFNIKDKNLEVIYYDNQIILEELFAKLKSKGIERITIQSGGTMNTELIRQGLIDEIHIVIAPIVVGGGETASLADGESVSSIEDIGLIKEFSLIASKQLKESFLELRYKKEK